MAAAEAPINAYLDDLEAACRQAGATLRLATDPIAEPELLAGFDRVVIATGARYRHGLGSLVRLLLERGIARRGWPRRLFARPRLRRWFYERARRPSGERLAAAIAAGPIVEVIGDARAAGKAKPAIASAFEAALGPPPAKATLEETPA